MGRQDSDNRVSAPRDDRSMWRGNCRVDGDAVVCSVRGDFAASSLSADVRPPASPFLSVGLLGARRECRPRRRMSNFIYQNSECIAVTHKVFSEASSLTDEISRPDFFIPASSKEKVERIDDKIRQERTRKKESKI